MGRRRSAKVGKRQKLRNEGKAISWPRKRRDINNFPLPVLFESSELYRKQGLESFGSLGPRPYLCIFTVPIKTSHLENRVDSNINCVTLRTSSQITYSHSPDRHGSLFTFRGTPLNLHPGGNYHYIKSHTPLPPHYTSPISTRL